jgi:hypothetical protein
MSQAPILFNRDWFTKVEGFWGIIFQYIYIKKNFLKKIKKVKEKKRNNRMKKQSKESKIKVEGF